MNHDEYRYNRGRPTDEEESDSTNSVNTKRVLLYGWDTSGLTKVKVAVDSSGNLQAGSAAPTSIGDNSRNVTTAGTRVQLSASSVPCKYVIITAKEANTGTIWVGGSTVAAGRGRPLVALQSEKIDISNLNLIYLDATVNGEGVTYAYVA